MNINANELLLLKKIKFAAQTEGVNEGVNNGVNQEVSSKASVVTEPEANKPQTGLNILAFQGMKNVASDPKLSQELGVMKDAEPQKNDSVNEYVAPYKSNIAFQGKASQFKTVVLGALMGLASLGAVSTMTSCTDEYTQSVSQEVTVDMTELVALIQQMLEQMQVTNSQLQQINAYMLQLMDEVRNGNINASQFYEKMFDFMVVNQTNQEIIIEQLVQNGKTQEEANQLIKDLIAQVQSGQISAEEAWNKIQSLLGDIKGLLQQALTDFNKFYEQMLAKQDELIETNKKGFDELIKRGDITNETLNKLTEQNDSLIILNNKASEERQAIKEAIEKANIDSNANFETVVSTLNANKNDLIKVLMKLGYTQAQIEKMTAAQIIAAINHNTAVTECSNALLSMIAKQLTILPKLLEQGKITNAQLQELNNKMTELMDEVKNGNLSADEFYQKAVEYMLDSKANQQVIIQQLVNNGKTQAEANRLLQQLINDVKSGNKTAEEAFNEIKEILVSIDTTVKDMYQTLQNLYSSFNSFYNDYKYDKDQEFKMLGSLIKDNKIQTSILASMKKTQESMAENINSIKSNTDSLLLIANDDTKYNELIEAIKNIQINGSGSIDYDRLESMFKQMGISISDAINMSKSELVAAIKDFQNTYVNTEQKQTEELQTINGKLDDLQMFAGLSLNEIVQAINKVTSAVNSGNADISAELKALEAALNKLQAQVDALLKEVGTISSTVNSYFSKFDSQFNKALGYLSDIKNNTDKIYSAQLIANKYLENLETKVEELKVEIKKIEESMGGNSSSITLEQLEKMWKEHDEANYNKYKELLENMDINVNVNTGNIEALLKSIDAKMDMIKDNSEILDKIYNKIKDIDWTSPDYSAKLDKVIEILENFKCNCECGGNNEGILGDLDKVLG